MNKQIRKKQLRRIICNMVAAYQETEERRKRFVCLAQQEVLDAYGKSTFPAETLSCRIAVRQ